MLHQVDNYVSTEAVESLCAWRLLRNYSSEILQHDAAYILLASLKHGKDLSLLYSGFRLPDGFYELSLARATSQEYKDSLEGEFVKAA